MGEALDIASRGERARQRGFSYVELLAALAVIVIIAGIAISIYFRFIQKTRETAVVAILTRIVTAQEAYRISSPEDAYTGRFEDIGVTRLVTEGGKAVYIDHGYRSVLSSGTDADGKKWWQVTATPVDGSVKVRWFYADQTGKVRYEIGKTPDGTSPVASQ